jgi:hypothetical protein
MQYDINYVKSYVDGDSVAFRHVNNEIYGTIKHNPDDLTYLIRFMIIGDEATYRSSNPVHRNYSYSGSGLPYPTPEEAYENTPNKGVIKKNLQGVFEISVKNPSGYYVHLGKQLIHPHVHIKSTTSGKSYIIMLGDHVQYKSLSSLPNQPYRSSGR